MQIRELSLNKLREVEALLRQGQLGRARTGPKHYCSVSKKNDRKMQRR